MRSAVLLLLFWKKKIPIKGKQDVNKCLKSLILFVFTILASRLASEQKEKEK